MQVSLHMIFIFYFLFYVLDLDFYLFANDLHFESSKMITKLTTSDYNPKHKLIWTPFSHMN
jgi:hypothetical protein